MASAPTAFCLGARPSGEPYTSSSTRRSWQCGEGTTAAGVQGSEFRLMEG